jgi:hypothetical protein
MKMQNSKGEMEVLKNEIEDEKLKLAQFQQELPPST